MNRRMTALCLAAILLCGCLTLEHSLRLTEANALIVGYVYTYDTAAEPTIAAALEEIPGLHWRFFDEKSVRDSLTRRNLELVRYRKAVRGSRTTVEISVISRNAAKTIASGAFPELRAPEEKSLEMTIPAGTIPADRLKRLLPDFKASLTISVPGVIESTSGRRVDDETAVWEYTPGDAVVQPVIRWK